MAGRYKPYSEYKDSGVKWLGSIPVEWSKSFVKHWLVSSPCYGILKPDKYDGEGGVKVVRILDVSERTVLLDNLEIVSPLLSAEYSRTLIKSGDLIVSVVGTLGRSFICREEHEGMNLSRALARMQVKDSRKTRYLQYVIDSNCFEGYVSVTCNGAAQKVFNMEDLSNWSIPSPDECALDKIADFLDHETAKIDTLIEKQQQLIQLLKEKRQAVISHAVTKGLSSLNGGPSAKMRDSGVEWLGEVPEGWEIKKLKYLCTLQTGDKNTEDAVSEGEYPFFVRSQTVERLSSFTADCEAVLTAGDGVGVGKVFHYIDGKFDFHQRVYMMNKFNFVNGKFFFHYLSNMFHKVALDGGAKSTVDSLRMPVFTNFIITVPSMQEQASIVKFVESSNDLFDDLTLKASNAIELMQERRTALISAAVTGKIDVRDWVAPLASPTHKEVAA